MREMQKKLSNIFYVILSFPATAMGFALSIQISALSWIMSYKYHLNIEEVGIVWAAGPLAGIFGQVIIGLISDKTWFWGGRRRPFVLIGGTLAALMLLALPNIDKIQSTLGIEHLIIVAIFVALTLDLAINISFNPTRSIIADVTPDGEKRTKGYTWMQTISGTFGMLAYAIGATLGNFVLIYTGSIIVLLFSIIPMFFIKEEKTISNDIVSDKQETKFSFIVLIKTIEPLLGFLLISVYYFITRIIKINIPENISNIIFIILSVFQLFLTLRIMFKSENTDNKEENYRTGYKKALSANAYAWVGIQTMFVFTFAYIKQMLYGDQEVLSDIEKNEIGRIISYSFLILNAVGAILPAILLEPLSKKIGRIKVNGFAVGIMALAYWSMSLFATSYISLWVLMGIAGIGWAAVVSLPFAIMSEKVEKNKMGLYMGIFNLSIVFPQLFVSWGLSKLIAIYPDKIYLISGFALTISAILWLLIKDNKNKE